jgi:nitrogen regulatory protein P-II 1
MFMITAVIQPAELTQVRAELVAAGITGMTVSECAGHGRDACMVPGLRGGPDVPRLVDNLQIEVAVPNSAAAATLEAIRRGAAFGERGKIFVSAIERVVSIRTGLDDDLALNAPSHVWFEAAE